MVFGSEIYNIEKRYELGCPYFTRKALGKLVSKEIPVSLTDRTADGKVHWSNDKERVGLVERLKGWLFPTHIMSFTPVENGELKLTYKPIE